MAVVGRYQFGGITIISRNGSLVTQVGLAILALISIFGSLHYGIGQMNKPEAGFFPLVIGIALLVNVVYETVVLVKCKTGAKDTTRYRESTEVETVSQFINLSMIITSLVLWPILISYLGFSLVTFIATFMCSKALGLEGWRKPVALSLCVTAVSYYLFKIFLYLDLPEGIIEIFFDRLLK